MCEQFTQMFSRGLLRRWYVETCSRNQRLVSQQLQYDTKRSAITRCHHRRELSRQSVYGSRRPAENIVDRVLDNAFLMFVQCMTKNLIR